ncbi:response regulator [Pseudomonas sp. v388]|uniref:response regulator transcription factor n=1 Tax=Pseudomonas sp. v388 TaxID=2479849 RepID=UPI000F7A8036|nr:response regulator [Pseudomonas sp. v388]RRV06313.1 response regulator [Pseudomonas sp. v388]
MITVCVVDDDLSVRKSLVNLLKSAGYRALGFVSGEELLVCDELDAAACVLLDLRMKGLQGPDVQIALNAAGTRPAVICMSAHWDEASLVEAKGNGACDCLHKPFTGEVLLSAIESALHHQPRPEKP